MKHRPVTASSALRSSSISKPNRFVRPQPKHSSWWTSGIRAALLQAKGLDPDVVLLRVARVDAVGKRLDERQQGSVRTHERRRVGGVVEPDPREPGYLGEGR